MSADLKLVTLNESNFRDPAATLRQIADEIESGEYGEVGCVGIAVLGDELIVVGAGQDAEAPSVACVLQAGAMKLIGSIVDHGKS